MDYSGYARVGRSYVGGPDLISGYIYFFPDTKVTVRVEDGATKYFEGILQSIKVSHRQKKVRILHCICNDYNQIIEERVVDELETFETDTGSQIIFTIFSEHAIGAGIDFTTHVDVGGYVFELITFEDVTLRHVMDTLCAQTGYVWWIDYDLNLHYHAAGTTAPGWYLTSKPDGVNSFGYIEVKKNVKATNLVNKVFLVGGKEQK